MLFEITWAEMQGLSTAEQGVCFSYDFWRTPNREYIFLYIYEEKFLEVCQGFINVILGAIKLSFISKVNMEMSHDTK